MKHFFARIALPILAGLVLMFGNGSVAFAACSGGGGANSEAKSQVLKGVGQTGSNCNGSGVNKTIQSAVKIISYFAGVVAIIMIIVSGFRYMTSGGDSAAVGSAKTSLIYALIGLAVAVAAQFLVGFVLHNVKV